jgi:acetyl-CoA carboxylase carboxyltransferase component
MLRIRKLRINLVSAVILMMTMVTSRMMRTSKTKRVKTEEEREESRRRRGRSLARERLDLLLRTKTWKAKMRTVSIAMSEALRVRAQER